MSMADWETTPRTRDDGRGAIERARSGSVAWSQGLQGLCALPASRDYLYSSTCSNMSAMASAMLDTAPRKSAAAASSSISP